MPSYETLGIVMGLEVGVNYASLLPRPFVGFRRSVALLFVRLIDPPFRWSSI